MSRPSSSVGRKSRSESRQQQNANQSAYSGKVAWSMSSQGVLETTKSQLEAGQTANQSSSRELLGKIHIEFNGANASRKSNVCV